MRDLQGGCGGHCCRPGSDFCGCRPWATKYIGAAAAGFPAGALGPAKEPRIAAGFLISGQGVIGGCSTMRRPRLRRWGWGGRTKHAEAFSSLFLAQEFRHDWEWWRIEFTARSKQQSGMARRWREIRLSHRRPSSFTLTTALVPETSGSARGGGGCR